MEGFAVKEAAKVFYRTIALQYLVALSPVQKELDEAKLKLQRVKVLGISECSNCGTQHWSQTMYDTYADCYCNKGSFSLEHDYVLCKKCYASLRRTICCDACANEHEICTEHATNIGCEIVVGCTSQMSTRCRPVRTCNICTRKMCTRHARFSTCEECYADFTIKEEEERVKMSATLDRFKEELRETRATKKTKL